MDVGVIGSAGRRDDGPRMSAALFEAAVDYVDEMLRLISVADRHLRSGGAAWMDHVSVALFLRGRAASLRLFLPCAWNPHTWEFVDTGARDWKTNPGGTSNHYHRQFSGKLGRSSLGELQNAMDIGAVVAVVTGFHNRNVPVGQVDALIALTWGPGDVPKDGGTADTWRGSPAPQKFHVPLATVAERVRRAA